MKFIQFIIYYIAHFDKYEVWFYTIACLVEGFRTIFLRTNILKSLNWLIDKKLHVLSLAREGQAPKTKWVWWPPGLTMQVWDTFRNKNGIKWGKIPKRENRKAMIGCSAVWEFFSHLSLFLFLKASLYICTLYPHLYLHLYLYLYRPNECLINFRFADGTEQRGKTDAIVEAEFKVEFLSLATDCRCNCRSVSFSEIVPPVQVVHCQANGGENGEAPPPSYAQSQQQPATEMHHLQP